MKKIAIFSLVLISSSLFASEGMVSNLNGFYRNILSGKSQAMSCPSGLIIKATESENKIELTKDGSKSIYSLGRSTSREFNFGEDGHGPNYVKTIVDNEYDSLNNMLLLSYSSNGFFKARFRSREYFIARRYSTQRMNVNYLNYQKSIWTTGNKEWETINCSYKQVSRFEY